MGFKPSGFPLPQLECELPGLHSPFSLSSSPAHPHRHRSGTGLSVTGRLVCTCALTCTPLSQEASPGPALSPAGSPPRPPSTGQVGACRRFCPRPFLRLTYESAATPAFPDTCAGLLVVTDSLVQGSHAVSGQRLRSSAKHPVPNE